ncbi:MAG: type III-A CRISPR-associated RAMP protein Csm4 [Flavobacteriaceae bacterium]|nr:type III-A CRISPR-associated RAMP protein Csm4 [Flavobacteriaceae bacterium]
MKAIELRLSPNSKFHLGEYVEDQTTALFNTAHIIHSDVLFGAFISALVKIKPEKLASFKTYFQEAKLSISSAFYLVKLKEGKEIYLLPKPVSLNLFQPKNIENFQVKKFKKIEFISKGVWEKGISPEEWFEGETCVMPNNKTLCLRSEVGDEKFELFAINDEEKVNLTSLAEKNELYTRSNLEILGTENAKVSFYFLMKYDALPDEDKKIIKSVLELLILNGIGGERYTGCGVVEAFEEKNFEINISDPAHKTVLLGLAFPKNLEKYHYYQTKVRGGMNFGANKRIKLLNAIQEGAIVSPDIESQIIDLSQDERKYWKYSSNIQLPLHKNYDL